MTYPLKERNGRWYELRNGRWHRDERAFRSAWQQYVEQISGAPSITMGELMADARRAAATLQGCA